MNFRSSTSPRSTSTDSPMDTTTYVLIILVILIPLVFTIVLCSITYCVYRYNKKRSDNNRRHATTVVDRPGAPLSTVIYNPQHNPYSFEELPPAYHTLAEMKKDLYPSTTIPSDQPVDLRTTTSTNEGAGVTIAPSAPAQLPPPSYIDLAERNQ